MTVYDDGGDTAVLPVPLYCRYNMRLKPTTLVLYVAATGTSYSAHYSCSTLIN